MMTEIRSICGSIRLVIATVLTDFPLGTSPYYLGHEICLLFVRTFICLVPSVFMGLHYFLSAQVCLDIFVNPVAESVSDASKF